MILNVFIIVITFLGMEFIAWVSHKYVMHGFMWHFHEDHHDAKHSRFFERNDTFFLIFAIPSWLNIMFGMMDGYDFKLYVGLGILFYGITYFIVHDVIIHQRFKWFSKSGNWYVNGIKRAHKIHHKNRGKEQGENFGMLIAPLKYFKKEAETTLTIINS